MTLDFLLLGGDARQTALARLLSRRFQVGAIGVPGWPDTENATAKSLVLPVPSCWSDGIVRGVAWETLESLLSEGVTVYGGAVGILPDQLEPYGARCIDLLKDPCAVAENAALTADAAVLLAMQHTERSLTSLPCCVVGYGRIGRLLCRRLQGFGARICVISGHAEKRALASAAGYSALPPEEICRFQPTMVFNTAPASFIPLEALKTLPEESLWIELASSPGGLQPGTKYPFARLPAGGLPGKLLPVSAAEVLYRAILRTIEGQ